jgi:threonine dehydratase
MLRSIGDEVKVDRRGIEAVHRAIGPYVRQTPTLRVSGVELGLPPCDVTLKLESLQHAGAFKTRGAFANLLTREIPAAGVVAASGGNHGAAVAYAAMRLGIRAKIFIPTVASPAKVERIRACGADLAIVGDLYADALAASETWAAETGALPVHAFEQLETLLGQGTVGLELTSQAPELDTILVPIGGGGLIGGIAAWYGGSTRVVGVEPELAPTLSYALRAGRPVDAPAGGIAADALAPKRVGELMFPIAQAFVHSVVLVSEDALASAQRQLWDRTRIVAEPAGAAAYAAVLSGAYVPADGERVGFIVSGGNTSAVTL